MTDRQTTVLVVEDDFLIAAGLSAQIEDMGHCVCGTASSSDEAIAIAREYQPDIILMDMRLDGEGDGVDAAWAIQAIALSRIVFITGSRDPKAVARIEQAHPAALLFKPVSAQELRETIAELELH